MTIVLPPSTAPDEAARFTGPDRVTLVAPLGVRFWDAVSERIVSDDLVAHAAPADDRRRRVPSFVNPSGVHVFRNLPGLREFENGTGDASFWNQTSPRQAFVVTVEDRSRRFQPFSFSVPLPARGLLTWDCDPSGSPPQPAAAVPLFSTPNRVVPAGFAVIRAELWDDVNAMPASWAVVEAQLPAAPIVRGLADRMGRVALIFPYPEPRDDIADSPSGSPPHAPGVSMFGQRWDVALGARFAPWPTVPAAPDLCDALRQPLATLLADSGATEPLGTKTLHFGRELIVRSAGAAHGRLLVRPMGSPP